MRNNASITLIATFLLVVSTCLAQTGGYHLKFTLSKQNFVDSIRISFEHGQVFVPVTIGSNTYNFLLDTGASNAVIYDDTPIDGCLPAGHITTHDAVGHKDTVQLLTLPPFTIGTLTLSGCQATLQRRAVKRRHIDGILGFDLVCKGLQMKIDVRQQLLILTDQKNYFDRESGYETRYRLNYHVPYINIKPFTKYEERVLFDTGSRQLYSMNKQSFDRAEQKVKDIITPQIEGRSIGRHAMGHSGTESLGEVVFLALDSLQLGGFSFRNVHLVTTQGGSHVGARLLEYGAVVFNPRRKRIRFQPYSEQAYCTVDNEQLQKAIVNDGGHPTIGLVWEHSEAYQAGLREGDVLIKADDRNIGTFDDYVNFRPLRGHYYKFTVRDKRGFLKEVTMKW